MSVIPATTKLWQGIAIGFAIAFAYATVFVKLSRDWWNDENYSHGLLIPFIIGYIIWSQRDKLSRARVEPSILLGGIAIVAALLGLWAGVAGAELYIQRLSLILLLAGIAVYLWGFKLLQFLLVPLSLLFLAMPIPSIVFNKIAFPLQLFASRCAVWSMGMLGIPVLRQGNIIELKPLNSFDTKKLEVVEACSGIRSLMTLLTLAVVFAYFTHTPSGNPPASGKRFGWLKKLLVLALDDHRALRGAHCHFDECIQSERHRRLSALLRNSRRGRFLPLIFGMGHLYRGFHHVVWYWHDS